MNIHMGYLLCFEDAPRPNQNAASNPLIDKKNSNHLNPSTGKKLYDLKFYHLTLYLTLHYQKAANLIRVSNTNRRLKLKRPPFFASLHQSITDLS